jgi:hypothetical protein
MPPLSLPALPSGQPTAWEEAIYAFLVEESQPLGLDPDRPELCPNALAVPRREDPGSGPLCGRARYAHGIGLSGRTPSFATVGARIACLSSFYRFTIRMGLLTANPCDALERPRIATRCRDLPRARVGRGATSPRVRHHTADDPACHRRVAGPARLEDPEHVAG